MSGTYRLILLATIAGISVVSVAPAAHGQALTSGSARDTALLTAVVRAVQKNEGPLKLLVDPRPLRPDGEIRESQPHTLAPVSAATLQMRQTALRLMGIGLVDAVAVENDMTCKGIWVFPLPADSQSTEPHPHAGCPSDDVGVVAIGLPRPGTARPDSGKVYDIRADAAAVGYWAVLVIVTNLGPGGRSVTGWDFVMKGDGRTWRFVEAVGLFNAH